MLPKEIIKKIKRVHLKSSMIVNSVMAGQYKSAFKGSGIEFDEFREYAPGDEVKNIDWKVSARSGKTFIKLYREEREKIVILMIDLSSSVFFGTCDLSKREKAAELASIIAFNATKNNDQIGAIFFSDKIEKFIPPKKGSSNIWHLIKEIFTLEPENTKTNIEAAIRYLNNLSSKKAHVFLISDFLSQNYTKALKIANKKHNMVNILLSDKNDFYLPKAKIVRKKDLETNKFLYFDCSDAKTQKLYTKIKEEEYSKIVEDLKNTKIDLITLKTNEDSANALVKYFRYKEKRKR